MSPRTHEPAALDDALARWDPSTGSDAATLLATTGDRLGRTDLADRLADGSTFDARTWWTDAVGPGIRRLVDAGIVEEGPAGFRWIGADTAGAGGTDA